MLSTVVAVSSGERMQVLEIPCLGHIACGNGGNETQRGSGSSGLSVCLRRVCYALTGLTTDDTNVGGGSADNAADGDPTGVSEFLADFAHQDYVRVCAKSISPTRTRN